MSHETEHLYPVKESTLRLTAQQRCAAADLLTCRPAVVPGTRAILNPLQAKVWFDKVCDEMRRLELADDLVGPFCDVAGVPD